MTPHPRVYFSILSAAWQKLSRRPTDFIDSPKQFDCVQREPPVLILYTDCFVLRISQIASILQLAWLLVHLVKSEELGQIFEFWKNTLCIENITHLFGFGKDALTTCFAMGFFIHCGSRTTATAFCKYWLLLSCCFTDSRDLCIALVSEASILALCCMLLLYGAHRVSA